jgi:hypothetical protein
MPYPFASPGDRPPLTPPARVSVLASNNLFVDGSIGLETNPGTAAAPFRTIQAAVNSYLANYDSKSIVTNIWVNNGTYAPVSIAGQAVGTAAGFSTPAYLSIIGINGAANTIISDTLAAAAIAGAVVASSGAFVALQGLTIQSVNNNCLFSASGAIIQINSGCVLGTAGAVAGKLHADYGAGMIVVAASYTSVGNAGSHVQGSLAGHIIYNETPLTVTLSGETYSIAFVDGHDNSLMYINNNFVTFSGTCVGKRFNLLSGSVLECQAGPAASYIPGTIAGTVSDGSFYAPGTFNIGTSPIVASNTTATTPANPAGTTNATGNGVYMGLAGSITPRTSGAIEIKYTGSASNAVVGAGAGVSIYVGTGSAPANGAAAGTSSGSPSGVQQLVSEPVAGGFVPVAGSTIVPGQGLGTPLWYDTALVSRDGNTVNLWQFQMTAKEV